MVGSEQKHAFTFFRTISRFVCILVAWGSDDLFNLLLN